MATNSIKLLTGNSHPQLAKQVADRSVFVSTGNLAGKRWGAERGADRIQAGHRACEDDELELLEPRDERYGW